MPTPNRPLSIHPPDPALGRDPTEVRALTDLRKVLAESGAQIARTLGGSLTKDAATARILIGPARCNPAITEPATEPTVTRDATGTQVVIDAPDVAGVWELFDLLEDLPAEGGARLTPADCATVEDAADRLERAVERSWSGFEQYGVDWAAVSARHRPRVLAARDPVPALQAWIAELPDAHTWVRPTAPQGRLPYEARVAGDNVVLFDVPETSAGFHAGARAGWRLLGLDIVAKPKEAMSDGRIEGDVSPSFRTVDIDGTWARTSATPHSKPLVVPYRAFCGPLGEERELIAESPRGVRVTWRETLAAPDPRALVAWRHLPSGAGYLRIGQWHSGAADAIAEGVDALRGAPGLVVDLRGNGGGNGPLAWHFRSRFLRRAGPVGHIRWRDPAGRGLTPPEPLLAEPAAERDRWPTPVRFLTDARTYSASEEAMLGLAGEPHVRVIGEPSGGGSGRMRAVRLLPGWRLTITTCQTYTLGGHCIEGHGVPVDERVVAVAGEDRALEVAERGW